MFIWSGSKNTLRRSFKLSASVLMVLLLQTGCQMLHDFHHRGELKPLLSPYEAQRIWAVLPIQNESGFQMNSQNAISQDLVRHLENAGQIEVWPMSRTNMALREWPHARLDKPEQAAALMRQWQVDGLVVSSLISYYPYNPPRMGIAIELYLAESALKKDIRDVRALVRAATDPYGMASGYSADQNFQIAQVNQRSGKPILSAGRPVTAISLILDARDGRVRSLLGDYVKDKGLWPEERRNNDAAFRYQVSMPLYQDFVAYETARRLLDGEWQRFEQIEWMSAQAELERQAQIYGITGAPAQSGVRQMHQRRSDRAIKRRH